MTNSPGIPGRLAIVCPMANEAQGAVDFVGQVLAQCSGFKDVMLFAVVDGASRDNTRELLEQHACGEDRLSVVWAPENRCVVDAYVRGYREALASGADWVLEIDAGFSHQPSDIPRFFAEMAKGYDCVFGTRFGKGGRIENSSWQRLFVSRGGTLLTRLVLKARLSDMTSGFQLFRSEILRRILEKGLFSRGPFFQTEMKAYCQQLRNAEVPITYRMASHRVGVVSIREAFAQLRRLMALKRSKLLFI